MYRFTMLLAAVAVSLAPFNAGASAERGSEAEALTMVKKAIAFYDKNGREKTFAELSHNPGPFVHNDLYVTVNDMNGTSLAHINPKMMGKNLIDLRDADGKYIQRERIEAARSQTTGWQDYKFYNPATKKIEAKHTFWEKHDNLLFACGAYKPE